MDIIIIYLLIVNAAAFLMYGLDKWKAKRDAWRIPEKTLLGVALIGGSIGAFAGMQVFHHKTKHVKFTVGVPLIIVLQAVVVWFVFF